MIDFGNELTGNYGKHRHGWSWVLEQAAQRLHSSDAEIEIVSFIEKKFLFGSELGDIKNCYAPPLKKWIGFLHVPPYVPYWFSPIQQLRRLADQHEFQNALNNCKGIVCLSKYLCDYSRLVVAKGIPHFNMLHPTDEDVMSFDPKLFTSQNRIPVVQLGYWLRRLSCIHKLRINNTDYAKVLVGVNQGYQALTLELDLLYNGVSLDQSVIHTGFLSDQAYDRILSKSVVVIDFYDTSANNALIECVARATPMILPRHPAIVEYLGRDYPLYSASDSETEYLLSSRSEFEKTALSASDYLDSLRKSGSLAVSRFIYDLANVVEEKSSQCHSPA